jgi:hypothetical protein
MYGGLKASRQIALYNDMTGRGSRKLPQSAHFPFLKWRKIEHADYQAFTI